MRKCLPALICLIGGVLSFAAQADTIDEFVDLRFKSSTTLEKPADSVTFQVLRSGGIPIKLDMEVRPIQGTFTIEYENQLRIQYDDSQLKQGGPALEMDLDWFFKSGSFGQARVRQGYTLIPIVEIDFNELFNSSVTGWSTVADSLPMPIEGSVIRRPAFAAQDIKLHLFDTQTLDGLAVNSLILEDSIDSFNGVFALGDTQSFSTSFIPYPCLRVDLDLQARLDLKYTYKNTEVCVRYSSADNDTMCWTATDSFSCISSFETVTIPVQIGCEEVRHKIIPFCPITAQGEVDLDVKLSVDVNLYSIAYECSDILPENLTAISTSTTSPVDTIIFDQTVVVERADDDAILAIPVPFSQPAFTAPTDGTTLTSGSAFNVTWDPTLASEVLACCSDSLLVDLIADSTDPSVDCETTLVLRTPNDGSHSWTPPGGLDCASQSQAMRITARFFCAQQSSDLILAHAYSDTFFVQDISGGKR